MSSATSDTFSSGSGPSKPGAKAYSRADNTPRTTLFRRFFAVVVLIMTMMFVVIYFYSVPLIQKEVYQIELKSARLTLNNTFQLANTMHSNLESYRKQALEAHKERLKAVVDLSEVHLEEAFEEAHRTGVDFEQAKKRIFEGLRNFTYDNGGYIWITDYGTQVLSHPDPFFHNMSIAKPDMGEQTEILRNLVQSAQEEGEGFYQYQWQRLNERVPTGKLSYVKSFPKWGFVIGSGLYLDDIEREVEKRKQGIIEEVTKALEGVTVGKSGYVFVFDKAGNLIIHPSAKLRRAVGFDLKDPVTGLPILENLMNVADTGKEWHYKWDKPSDPENYIYDKVSLARSLDGLGWYICSSVYEDELKQSAELLSERILTIALFSTLIATALALFFIRRITRPINQLASTAEQIRAGDLTATSGVVRNDEIGVLAQTFDTMVQRLHDNIQTLDDEVQSRTQELAQQEERQRLILDALPAQIAYLDKNLKYIFVNQGYAEMFNRSKEEIVGKSSTDILGSEMMASIHHQIDQCLAGKPSVYEYSFTQDQRQVITKRKLIPYLSDKGEVIGVLNLSLDITSEKDAEIKLMEAQRMSAAGQLAGGLAHDFNNLLTVIMGNLLAAKDHFDEVEGLKRYINPAIRASRRGADITGRLLAFSRRQALAPCAVDLRELLEETTELLEGSLPDNINVSSHIVDNPQLVVDPGQLENALVNLALNARDAMPEGGDITFNIQMLTVTTPLNYDDLVPPGRYVEIQINDTGAGFSSEAKTLAYEPFFTTKSVGEGTGLGLSMVYGFIKQSRGFIAINSEPGKGASISLLLPLKLTVEARKNVTGINISTTNSAIEDKATCGIATGGTEDRTATGNRATGELILLVEDDSDVRMVVRDQLTSLGYTVIEACDADEAEQLITTLDSIEGLVSDVNMPGRLDGFGLAELMYQHNPDSQRLIISGNEYEQDSPVSSKKYQILRKPFDKATLERAMAQAKELSGHLKS
ncbi:cache domain-containing protein [Oceanospirillum beijerinckii]|uniref:cache domain-containing protein n=1 Tax=Oceanospirillum beijerinckii TaxID=64976 RepID=UPI000415ED7C|nr:cache domain-containing protein [Oceanospirillum beijerinckii]